METASIKSIRETRDQIREKIKTVNYNANKSNTYGSENEYNFRGIIGGLENLLIDISTLTKAPNKFLTISTYEERNNIYSYLNSINIYFDSPNTFITYFESLKILLRGYNIRSTTERQIEFETEMANVLKMKLQVEEELTQIINSKQAIEEKSVQINEKIALSTEKQEEIELELEKVIARKDELVLKAEELKNYNDELNSAKETADENLVSIVSSMNESKSNEKLITSFANKVLEREKKLSELEILTEENTKKLKDYDNERQNLLNQALQLIESAKTALNYKTAEGISSSFQVQYESANSKWVLGSWIAGAIACLLLTIGLGIWILHVVPDNFMVLIARISLMPLPIIGAIFCANQYTKQKNIIEDYAYKMVLAKAIVGFSEQLKKHGSDNNEEYIHYIKTALEEIHKDPLRKRLSSKTGLHDNTNLTQIGEFVEKLSKLIKPE